MSVLNNSNAIESGGYNIDRSLRFRSSASAYLSRTFGATGDQQKWTWSGWAKGYFVRASGDYSFFGVSDGTGASGTELRITSAGYLNFYCQGSGLGTSNLVSSSIYRDPSAWYHIVCAVDTTQATAANRIKLYINGVQVTAFSTATYQAQNSNTYVGTTAYAHTIGKIPYASAYIDGYLAEVNFVNGQQLDPTYFGQTDAVTGVWTPKKYAGTYGTNGFYLDFKDNTSATTLAYDKSGNGNNWTANNISTTAGATYDSMMDVPTLTSATAANYCVLNPLTQYNLDGYPTAVTCYDGNLRAVGSAAQGTSSMGQSTFAVSSGKYYCEMTVLAINSANNIILFVGAPSGGYWGFYRSGGSGQGIIGTPATYTTNDVIGLAFDAGAGSFTFYKNGVQQCVNDPAWYQAGAITNIKIQLNATGDSVAFNFGQRPFSYTPPTGFKALNTFNLPDPVIKKPNQYMDATLWTGDQSARTITNSGNFQPDLVWTKSRSDAENHRLHDSVRGGNGTVLYELNSNLTEADGTDTLVSGMVSNGFTIASGANSPNITGRTYVGWQWKKGATPGFDIVTYTGTGSARTVSHSLGVAPKLIIIKNRSAVTDWRVWSQASGNGSLYLNTTASFTASAWAGDWNSTAPTSTLFSVGTNSSTNAQNYVAYLFAEIPGFSKFGSYTGNGSTDGPFVYCGFRPKFVMIKRTNSTENWQIVDSVRDQNNVTVDTLFPNLSNAESTGVQFDFTSNGLKVRSTTSGGNASGGTYIYAAFAESPFKYALGR